MSIRNAGYVKTHIIGQTIRIAIFIYRLMFHRWMVAIRISCTNVPPSSLWFTVRVEICQKTVFYGVQNCVVRPLLIR